MADRTERKRLVCETLWKRAGAVLDRLAHAHDCRPRSPENPDAWCDQCLILEAVRLLSEEGEPVAWLVEKHDGGWLLQRDATLYARSGFATGRIRPLYPGPVQEVSDA